MKTSYLQVAISFLGEIKLIILNNYILDFNKFQCLSNYIQSLQKAICMCVCVCVCVCVKKQC
jgi:hypothetical protein